MTTTRSAIMSRLVLHVSVAIVAAVAAMPSVASATNKLIEIMPDNMLLGAYIDRPQSVFSPKALLPILKAATDSESSANKLLDVIKRMPGPFAVGLFAPTPTGEEQPDYFFAVELTKPNADFPQYLEKTVLPAITSMMEKPSDSKLKLEKSDNGGRVLTKDGDACLFSYAIKGKVAFLSTKPQLALRWARGEWPKRRWVDMPGVRKLVGRLSKQSSVKLLFNPIPLVKMVDKSTSSKMEQLFLAPDEFKAVAAEMELGKNRVAIKVLASLADDCTGIAKVLVRPTNSTRSLGLFPDDFLAVGRIGWGRASDIVDGIHTMLDQIDTTISQEYREDLAEFRKTTGVEWDSGILDNLVGELAIGLRVNFRRKIPFAWVAILPLANETKFNEQFEKLISHFELTFQESREDDLLVRTATGTTPFSLTVASGYFIVGNCRETVREIASKAKQAKGAKVSELANRNLRTCYEALGEPNHFALLLDVEQLRKSAPMVQMAAGPALGPMLSEGYVGLTMSTEEGLAGADLVWSLRSAGRATKDTGSMPMVAADEAVAKAVTMLVGSLRAARRAAKQMVAQYQLRGIGVAIHTYAAEHKGAFPEDLEELVRKMSDQVTLDQLKSPYDSRGPKSISEVNRKAYVVYRSGLSRQSNPAEVLMAERKVHNGGAHFLFVDGHVELIPDPRASALLQMIEEGAEEIRR